MQRRSKEEEKHTKGEGNEDRRTLNIDGSEFMSNTGFV